MPEYYRLRSPGPNDRVRFVENETNRIFEVPVGELAPPTSAQVATALAGMDAAQRASAGTLHHAGQYGTLDPTGVTDVRAVFDAALAASSIVRVATPGKHRLVNFALPAGKALVWAPGARPAFEGTLVLDGRMVFEAAPYHRYGEPGEMGVVGDSRATGGYDTALNRRLKEGLAVWTCAEGVTRGVLRVSIDAAFPVSGTATWHLEGQITSVLTAVPRPLYCGILSGANDSTTITAEARALNVVNAWCYLLTNGILPIHVQDFPVNGVGNTTNWKKARYYANALLARHASVLGVFVSDPSGYMIDPASSEGGMLAALSNDGVHLNGYGQWVAGSRLGTDFLAAFPSNRRGYRVSDHNFDLYDATWLATGNLFANALYRGTAGTNQVSPSGDVVGSIPDNVRLGRNSGSGTITLASESAPAGELGNWWTFSVSSLASATQYVVNHVIASVPSGLVIESSLDVDVQMSSGSCQIVITTAPIGSTRRAGVNLVWSNGNLLSYYGRFTAARLTMDGTYETWLQVLLTFASGSTGTVKLRNPVVRPVI